VGTVQSFCYGANAPSGYVSSANDLGADCDDGNALVFTGLSLFTDSDGDGRTVGSATVYCIGNSIPVGFVQTTLGADCNDADANVWQSGTFYTDSDGDGYHGSSAVLCYGSTPPAGLITTLGSDCNDANAAINSGAIELCQDLVDNDCDGFVDEFCNTSIANDSPFSSVNVVYSSNMNFPNCYTVNGTLAGSTDSPESVEFTGADEWFKFTAISTAASITLSSTAQDDAIALYYKSGSNYILVGSENAASGNGDFERLNQGGLIPGTVYFVSVGMASGTTGGAYTLCIQNLVPSGCSLDIPAGGFNLCTTFKAVYRGSASQGATYTFNFTGVGGGASGTTSVTGTNLAPLANPALGIRYGGVYDVRVDVNYALQDGAGNTENVLVSGNSSSANCNDVTMMAQPAVAARGDQRCPASLIRGTYLNAARIGTEAICGAINYTFEFTQVVSCSNGTVVSFQPTVFTSNGNAPYLQLTVLPNLGNTGAWNVRARPNFSYGAGTYGPVQRIQVVGTSASGEVLYELADMEKEAEVEMEEPSLYPNPSNGEYVKMNLSNLEKGHLQVRVLDAAGRSVTSRVFAVEGSFYATLTFDEKLNAGVYMIETRNAGRVQTQRLVVQ
jgi:hypothetical protein